MTANSTGMCIVAWAFQVDASHRAEFEGAYGPNGDWVRLFREGDGYLKTELHRDPENSDKYVTLDFWQSREQYEKFKQLARARYEEIDAKCERLTSEERLLGEFDSIESLWASFPKLGAASQVVCAVGIRPAQVADITSILQIESRVETAAHWTEQAYRALFGPTALPRVVLVAENARHQTLGFAVGRIAADECELENIAVSPRETRQGIGSALLRELIASARARGSRRIFLEVRESNHAARRLYESFDFTLDGQREGYYSNPPENAMLYSLKV